jgi:predicted PurR-regulated permease PerM
MLALSFLFGFVGLLLAIPIAATVAVLLRFGLKRYLASPLYAGEEPRPS